MVDIRRYILYYYLIKKGSINMLNYANLPHKVGVRSKYVGKKNKTDILADAAISANLIDWQ